MWMGIEVFSSVAFSGVPSTQSNLCHLSLGTETCPLSMHDPPVRQTCGKEIEVIRPSGLESRSILITRHFLVCSDQTYRSTLGTYMLYTLTGASLNHDEPGTVLMVLLHVYQGS